MTSGRRSIPGGRWLLWGTVACLVVVATLWFFGSDDDNHDAKKGILPDGVDEASQVIEHGGTRVTVPSTWVHMAPCEGQDEQWGAANQDPCRAESFVVFYPAATFDPRHEPGVHRADDERSKKPAWSGYVLTEDWAVYVRDERRRVVRSALASVTTKD